MSEESQAYKLANWIVNKAIEGVPPIFESAKELAEEYLDDDTYENNDERVDDLIEWEARKSFTSGFVTSLGGILTLPVSVPSALGASWVIQARMIAAIAIIYGHNIRKDKVRTLVLLALLGDSIKEPLKDVGVKVGSKVTEKIIAKIPGRVIKEINKNVGFRLLTKAGEKGILNLTKCIPVVGGIISGSIDYSYCRKVGYIAKDIFRKKSFFFRN